MFIKYSMEELAEKFRENGVKSRKMNEENLQNFIENNVNQPTPEWFLDPFNINDALLSICLELIELRKK